MEQERTYRRPPPWHRSNGLTTSYASRSANGQIRSKAPHATDLTPDTPYALQTYNDVELDPSQPPLAFKQRVCELTGVPVERQKLMGKVGR